MIGMNILLGVFVVLFAIIGYVRGGAREGLVTASAILALYMITICEINIDFIKELAQKADGGILAFRLIVLGFMIFLGYETPQNPKASANNRFEVKTQQDLILGIILGAFNGYMIFGTVWFYLYNGGHPYPILSLADEKILNITREMMNFMPPAWLDPPVIYFAVAVPLFILLAIFL